MMGLGMKKSLVLLFLMIIKICQCQHVSLESRTAKKKVHKTGARQDEIIDQSEFPLLGCPLQESSFHQISNPVLFLCPKSTTFLDDGSKMKHDLDWGDGFWSKGTKRERKGEETIKLINFLDQEVSWRSGLILYQSLPSLNVRKNQKRNQRKKKRKRKKNWFWRISEIETIWHQFNQWGGK